MKIKEITENGILFDNGASLKDYHCQSCCEDVYADWQNMQVLTKLGMNSVNSDIFDFSEYLLIDPTTIKLEQGVGFSLIDKNGLKLFVSCYNIQNGYYGDDLKLIYKDKNGIQVELDIKECCKEEIY